MLLRLPLPVFLILLASSATFGQNLIGKVVSVYDGDTITVLALDKRRHKIRLAGIDAPELKQDFGRKARRGLTELVFGKSVAIEGEKIDRHGRRVAKVRVNGRDASLEMVASGLAWWYREYQREQSPTDREFYAAAEMIARNMKRNLWSRANPRPPWEFRSNRTILLVVPPGAEPPRVNAATAVQIVGNRNSKIYHWNPGCPDFFKVSERNRVPFKSRVEAESAGYRAARNCK